MTAKLLLPAQFVEEIEPVRRVKILSSPNFSMIHEWCLGFTGHLSAQLVQEEPVALRKEDEDSVLVSRRTEGECSPTIPGVSAHKSSMCQFHGPTHSAERRVIECAARNLGSEVLHSTE